MLQKALFELVELRIVAQPCALRGAGIPALHIRVSPLSPWRKLCQQTVMLIAYTAVGGGALNAGYLLIVVVQ